MGMGKNITLRGGGAIIGLPSIVSFTGTSRTLIDVNDLQVIPGAATSMVCKAFISGFNTTGVQTHLSQGSCEAERISSVWNVRFIAHGNNWDSESNEPVNITCTALCW